MALNLPIGPLKTGSGYESVPTTSPLANDKTTAPVRG